MAKYLMNSDRITSFPKVDTEELIAAACSQITGLCIAARHQFQTKIVEEEAKGYRVIKANFDLEHAFNLTYGATTISEILMETTSDQFKEISLCEGFARNNMEAKEFAINMIKTLLPNNSILQDETTLQQFEELSIKKETAETKQEANRFGVYRSKTLPSNYLNKTDNIKKRCSYFESKFSNPQNKMEVNSKEFLQSFSKSNSVYRRESPLEFCESKEGSVQLYKYALNISGYLCQMHRIHLYSLDITVKELKEECERCTGIEKDKITLYFRNKALIDSRKLKDYGIMNESNLAMISRIRGGNSYKAIYQLDSSLLDPNYDYDFTNIEDDGIIYKRGGIVYERPYGWKRYGLSVSNKYENKVWLGCKNVSGEWPVSYHGIKANCALVGIPLQGYKKGPGNFYGDGIYSTNKLREAFRYSSPIKCNGRSFSVIFQNRVNLERSKIKKDAHGKKGVDYYITNHKDIRPYGILFQEAHNRTHYNNNY